MEGRDAAEAVRAGVTACPRCGGAVILWVRDVQDLTKEQIKACQIMPDLLLTGAVIFVDPEHAEENLRNDVASLVRDVVADSEEES